jgi:hypothetical protein
MAAVQPEPWLQALITTTNNNTLSTSANFFIDVINHQFTPGSVLTTEYLGPHFRCKKL